VSVVAVRIVGTTIVVLVAALLAGCVSSSGDQTVPAIAGKASGFDLSGLISRVDLTPRATAPVNSAQASINGPRAASATYYGESGSPVPGAQVGAPGANPDADPPTTGSLPERVQTAPGDGYEMNFENTPVATVAKAILGDILGLGYTIDPRVQSTVSLSSGRAVPKKDLLFTLENALRVNSVALLREGKGYRLIPAADAVGAGSLDRAQGSEAGYGISVVPLHYISAQMLTKLLENFAAKPGMVRADASRNLLIIQGNGGDRRSAIETALSFDADWMRGQSVGIYPVSNSTPEPIIAELERIIDAGEGGIGQNVVKLQPITRQNAILVVTRKPELLNRISTWIQRLDKSGTAGTGVKVYRMRYGDARQIAALLNDVFLGNSANGLDSPVNQLAPGGGMVASSSGTSTRGSQQIFGQAQGGGAATAATPSTAPAGFDARFSDSAGARFAQNTTGAAATSGGGYGRGGVAAPSITGSAGSAILPNVRISADVNNNALLIYANQENYRIIERTLQQLDRPQLQVAIDATIAEITLNDTLAYGVQFYLKSNNVGLKPDKGSILNTLGTAAISRVLPGFNFLVGSDSDPRVILDALRTITDVKVLSTPSVVVIDTQFASLLVGDQIPITTRTAQSVDVPTAPVVNNIDYRNTGVILRVAPRINANGNVLLDIEQEISSVANNASAGTLTPTVSQRRVRSSIGVASGQTVLLGGLISEREDRARLGIPVLEQIPGLGELFSHNSGTMQRTELIIFIRPQIIRNGVDAYHVAQELRAKMRGFTPPVSVPPGAAKAKPL
jgi:general secretion pathway protein D